MRLPEIVGVAEAAAILGTTPPEVVRRRKAGRMPPSVADPRATTIWRKSDIEVLARDGVWRVGSTSSGRKPPRLALISTAEAAAILGCDKSQIGRWRRAGKFPRPRTTLAAGPIWLKADIVQFASRRAVVAA